MFDRVNGRFPVANGSRRHLLGQTAEVLVNREWGLTTFDFWVVKRSRVESEKKTNAHQVNWRSTMTLIKCILLGSAAGIVAVGPRANDLNGLTA